MNSFIDRLLGRSKLGSGNKPQDTPLSEAVRLVKEQAEGQISPDYPAFDKLCKAILSQATDAKKAAKGVGEGQLDKAMPQYQIGLQMQKNFAERVPSILDVLTLPNKDYTSYAQFHATALETIRTVAKVSKDNRYLPFFLSSEIGAFGKRMNMIVKLTDELGAALESDQEFVKSINTALRLEEKIRSLRKKLNSLVEMKTETAEKQKELETEVSSAITKNKEIEQEEGVIRQKVDMLQSQISAERKKLTDQLSPFQRQFRKLQKRMLEKEISKMLDDYIREPENTAINEIRSSGDYPLLRKILSELKIALERGEIEDDAKIRSRRIATIENIMNSSILTPAKRAIELGKELVDNEEKLRAVSKQMAHVDELQRKITHNTEQLVDLEKEEKSNKESIEKLFLELESLVNETIGETVKISRND